MNLLVILLLAAAAAASPTPEITGTVVDHNGKPASSVPISVVSITGDQVMSKTTSKADGSFQFSDLAPGAYGVVAKTASACGMSSAIKVASAFTTVVHIRLTDGLCDGGVQFVQHR
jgi:5-hydroxyisourate hydrolase-like protein (transthyretin family)